MGKKETMADLRARIAELEGDRDELIGSQQRLEQVACADLDEVLRLRHDRAEEEAQHGMLRARLTEAHRVLGGAAGSDLLSTLRIQAARSVLAGEPFDVVGFLRQVDEGALDRKAGVAYRVILVAPGDRKINVIKAIRELTGLGFREAKDLAERPDATVGHGLSRERAEEYQRCLGADGATTRIEEG